MKRATVSVVIPVFNAREFLYETLDSIARQTRPAEEVILVDDGSTDGCLDSIPRIGRSRVRVIKQANSGVAEACNTGVRHSRGDWVAFCGHDDLWDPHKLERQMGAVAARRDLVLCYADARFVGVGHPWDGDPYSHRAPPCPADSGECLAIRNFICACTVLARRRALLLLGLFDRTVQGADDWDMWIRLAREGRLLGLREVLAGYRIRPGSLSADKRRILAAADLVLGRNENNSAYSDNTRLRISWERAGNRLQMAQQFLVAGETRTARRLLSEALLRKPKLIRTLQWWKTYFASFVGTASVRAGFTAARVVSRVMRSSVRRRRVGISAAQKATWCVHEDERRSGQPVAIA